MIVTMMTTLEYHEVYTLYLLTVDLANIWHHMIHVLSYPYIILSHVHLHYPLVRDFFPLPLPVLALAFDV